MVDAHPVADLDAEELTHLDLVLSSSDQLAAETRVIAESLQSAVVSVAGVLAPLRPGLMPLGFSRDHGQDFLAVGSTADGHDVEVLPPGRTVTRIEVSDLPDPARRPEKFRETVQGFVGLLDAAPLHASDDARARFLVDVAACGLPVCVADPATLHGLLPVEIINVFASTDPRTLTSELDREQSSLRQRRVVHEYGSPRAVLDRLLFQADRPGLRKPSISVTVASHRPEMIPVWAGQLAVQQYSDFEIVAALHGDRFQQADIDLAQEILGGRLTVCRVPTSHTLGDALNAAATQAGGDLISKWDDDDLYDVEHLCDLVRALDYSGAALVGKAAEFAYLANMGITIRRLKTSTERFSQTICGATLTIRRSDLIELGGWRRSRRRVDSLLIEDVRASGGTTYRTSGFGFIMLRAGGDGHSHTWTADDNYFLRGAIDQRRGLDTAFAAVNAPASVVEWWES
ncbi:MAG: glycosyltransferase [Actinobacteria bacterium]|nr:glycosyltransferase [Actinomycetota bacterium]